MESESKLFQRQNKLFSEYNKIKEILKRETNLSSKYNNGISIEEFSSQRDMCRIENLLDGDIRTIWHSDSGMPQYVTVNLKKIKMLPKCIKYIGIYVWSNSLSNPKWIQLLTSSDGKNFESLGNFYLINELGTQLLRIRNRNIKNSKFIKILVKETYGANSVYINNLSFYENCSLSKSGVLISESIESMLSLK